MLRSGSRTRQRRPRPPPGRLWPGPGQRSRPSSITRAAIRRGRSRPASPETSSLAASASSRRWAVRSLTCSARRSRRGSRDARRRRPRCGRGRPEPPRSPALLRSSATDGLGCGNGRPDRRRRHRAADFEPVAADDQRVAVAQAARAVERLAVERRAVAAVEVGRHQHLAAALDLEVVPGDRLVIDVDAGIGVAADHGPLPRKRHRARLVRLRP